MTVPDRSIGWFDVSRPHSVGYQIMTKDGMKVYDINDHIEFEKEKERVSEYLRGLPQT